MRYWIALAAIWAATLLCLAVIVTGVTYYYP